MEKKLLLRILGPIIFLLIVFFYIDIPQLKQIVISIKIRFFMLSVLLVPLLIFIRSIRWGRILRKMEIRYSMWKCFRIYFVETVAVLAVATIGTFVKAFYPMREGFGLFRSVLTIVADKYFDYLLPLVLGFTSAVLIMAGLSPKPSCMVLLCVGCLAFVPAKKAAVFFSSRIIPPRLKALCLHRGWDLEKYSIDIENALDEKTFFLSALGLIVYYCTIYLLCMGLSIELAFSEVVIIETVTTVVTLMPISFFGIGTRDVGLLAVFKVFGHSAEEAIALSIALLLLRIAIVCMGSIFWFVDPPPLNELRQLKEL